LLRARFSATYVVAGVLTSSRATFEDQRREWANGDELTGNIVPDSWKGSNLVAEALL
jgi:hypothetical protein